MMQVKKLPVQALFGLPSMSAAESKAKEETTRGLSGSVRFFVDYCISVAVNSVARKQACRAKLYISGSEGPQSHVIISTLVDAGEMKFVAYSNDTNLFVTSSPGLFVINESPRELEHSIYLYLSERLCGQQSVMVQLTRETSSVYGLPVLEGSSEDGPRSLRVKAS